MSLATIVLFSLLGGGPPGDTAPAPPSSPTLSGRWAMHQVLSGLTEVPFIGDASADTHAVLVLDLEQRGDELIGEGKVCSLGVVARPSLIRPVLPDSMRKAIERQPFSARVVRDRRGLSLVGRRQTVVVGARLADVEKTPLPRAPDDASVSDTDEDGMPGITVRLEGLFDIDVYLAQRQWSRVEGREVAPGRFEGTVFHNHEQVLFGADSILMQALPEMTPNLERSRFRLVRLADDAGCREAESMALR